MFRYALLALVGHVVFCTNGDYFLPDEITSLPGWNGALPSRQFSGYLSVNAEDTWHMHYYFVESEVSSSNTPVMLWLNGGPGFSSMYGYLTEFGQFILNDLSFAQAGADGLKLFYNPYGWQKIAHILVLESPCGVGYSYCDGGCPQWNDTLTATVNYNAMLSFYKKFPLYANTPLYVVGESYAGVYIPMLAAKMVQENERNVNPKIPIAGVAPGNGCTGLGSFGPCGKHSMKWLVDFIGGHNGVSWKLFHDLQTNCSGVLSHAEIFDGPSSGGTGFGAVTADPRCNSLLAKLWDQAGGFDNYGWYDDCWGYGEALIQLPETNDVGETTEPQDPHLHQTKKLEHYYCGGDKGIRAWLNQPNVQKALHVPPMFWTHYDGTWPNYTITEMDVSTLYPEVLMDKIRILIYEGDEDLVAPVRAAEEMVTRWGLKETQEWRPWTVTPGSQVVYGYVVRYERNVDFLTIKGAGHMVPMMEPMHALAFLGYWFNFTDWPHYPKNLPNPFLPQPEAPPAKPVPFENTGSPVTPQMQGSPLWAPENAEELLQVNPTALSAAHISLLQQEVKRLNVLQQGAAHSFLFPFLCGTVFAVGSLLLLGVVMHNSAVGRRAVHSLRYTTIP